MASTSNGILKMWSQATWNNTEMMCQEWPFLLRTSSVWSNPYYPQGSESSICILLLAIILLTISTTSFLLRPLGLPVLSRMFGGFFVIGLLCSKNILDFQALLHPTVNYLIKTLSYLGFVFYSFILGVETNVGALLKRIDKETVIISFSGLIASLALSYAGVRMLNFSDGIEGIIKVILLNAQTFFMVTCNHVNEVGISNSQLGRLACAASLVLDIFGMFLTFLMYSLINPVLAGEFWHPVMVSGTYIFMFAVCRPLIIYIVSYTPEGERVKDSHFMVILLIVLLLAFLSLQVHHPLMVFLFGFFLPEEPLASILSEKLDTITSCVFFPIFCAMHGFEADFNSLSSNSLIVETIMILGVCGKFLGTLVPTMFFGVHLRTAISLSIIMSSAGLLDIVMLGQFQEQGILSAEHYTTLSLHILFCTGTFLPLVRYIYEPSTQYRTIIRQGILTSAETGTLRVLSCIYKEENLPGIIRLLQAFHSTQQKPLPVIALQLIPLTAGRVSLPILAPLHEIQSSSAYRSNLSRCNRTVNALVNLERKTNGTIRPHHYISVSSYTAMYNDICSTAHSHNVSLLILPFHAQWTNDMGFQHASQPIRDVNKMVLEKAPCSIGMLIDRGDQNQTHLSDVYHIAIFFIGGVDDQEALAYATIFVNHPNIRLSVIRLNSLKPSYNTFNDYNAIQDFQCQCKDNNRVSFVEVTVNDGGETTDIVVSMKDEIDLAVVGRYHEPGCTPLFGLLDRWCEYPELGIFGDMLVSPEFEFSVLVVQERPHKTKKSVDQNDIEDDEDDL
ncbi:cation/H(+) antiporter 14-like [Chenopodium quinoa]|uniref:cation/H(+) antiporter 14-like n=1 Tax=Chenopodium quinoa TaxID=63459 RepID=UPI000B789E2B|nr:cation/H(+) antiporter 14-like [Chenopodium quinoa]